MAILLGDTPGLILDAGDDPDLLEAGSLVPPPGEYRPLWVAPDGSVMDLNPPGSGFFSLRTVSGLGAVPVELVTTSSPDGGSIVDFVRAVDRTIIWPLRMRADTHAEFRPLWRAVTEIITQTRRLNKPGRLRLVREDGTMREIPAWYAGGLEQDAEDGAWLRQTAPVALRCPAPWWTDVDPIGKEWLQDTPGDYLNPYPNISSGQTIGAVKFTNDGVEPVWPAWTIRGPLTSLVATNTTRGESFTLTKTLTRGQTVTISGRPIEVRGPAGEQGVDWVNLQTGGVLWRLDPMVSTAISFTASGAAGESVAGAGDATSIKISFKRLYETA